MSEAMPVLHFDVVPLDDVQVDVAQVIPVIDGRSLVERVEAFERARGFDPPGGYGGLVPSFFRFGDLARYFLGPQEPWTDKATAVLACDCGELGCWPLQTHISVSEEMVSWHGFGQPHRPGRDYGDFGPFIFERRAYEAAVQRMLMQLASETDQTA